MDHKTMRGLAERYREAYADLVEAATRPGRVALEEFTRAQERYKEAGRAFHAPQRAAGWPAPHGVFDCDTCSR